MELTYRKEGDYFLPNILPPEPPKIERYGEAYLQFLKEEHLGLYYTFVYDPSYRENIETLDQQSNELEKAIFTQLKAKSGLTEDDKARNAMAWVAAMNEMKRIAQELVVADLLTL